MVMMYLNHQIKSIAETSSMQKTDSLRDM